MKRTIYVRLKRAGVGPFASVLTTQWKEMLLEPKTIAELEADDTVDVTHVPPPAFEPRLLPTPIAAGSRVFDTSVGPYTMTANALRECELAGADPQRVADNMARFEKRLPVRGPSRMSTATAKSTPKPTSASDGARVLRTKDGRELVTGAMTLEITPRRAAVK